MVFARTRPSSSIETPKFYEHVPRLNEACGLKGTTCTFPECLGAMIGTYVQTRPGPHAVWLPAAAELLMSKGRPAAEIADMPLAQLRDELVAVAPTSKVSNRGSFSYLRQAMEYQVGCGSWPSVSQNEVFQWIPDRVMTFGLQSLTSEHQIAECLLTDADVMMLEHGSIS